MHRRIEQVMADVWLGLALTCSYTLVAMAVVFVFLGRPAMLPVAKPLFTLAAGDLLTDPAGTVRIVPLKRTS